MHSIYTHRMPSLHRRRYNGLWLVLSGWGDAWNAPASVCAATGVPPPCSASSSVEVTGLSLHRTGSIRNIKFSVRFSGILRPVNPWDHNHCAKCTRSIHIERRHYTVEYIMVFGWSSVVGWDDSWNASASVSAATGVPPPCSASSSVEFTGRSLHRTGSIWNIKFSVRFSGILTPVDPWDHNHCRIWTRSTHRMPSLYCRRYIYIMVFGWCSVVGVIPGMSPPPFVQPQVCHLPAVYPPLWKLLASPCTGPAAYET